MTKTYISRNKVRDRIEGCPHCGENDAELVGYDYCGKEYSASYECRVCGCEFTDIYTYLETEWFEEVRG